LPRMRNAHRDTALPIRQIRRYDPAQLISTSPGGWRSKDSLPISTNRPMLRAAGVALVSVSVSASVPSTATVKRVPSMSILSKEPDELLFNGVQGGGPVRAPIFRAGFHVAAAAIGIPETLAPRQDSNVRSRLRRANGR
jgi:hypothetical protein